MPELQPEEEPTPFTDYSELRDMRDRGAAEDKVLAPHESDRLDMDFGEGISFEDLDRSLDLTYEREQQDRALIKEMGSAKQTVEAEPKNPLHPQRYMVTDRESGGEIAAIRGEELWLFGGNVRVEQETEILDDVVNDVFALFGDESEWETGSISSYGYWSKQKQIHLHGEQDDTDVTLTLRIKGHDDSKMRDYSLAVSWLETEQNEDSLEGKIEDHPKSFLVERGGGYVRSRDSDKVGPVTNLTTRFNKSNYDAPLNHRGNPRNWDDEKVEAFLRGRIIPQIHTRH